MVILSISMVILLVLKSNYCSQRTGNVGPRPADNKSITNKLSQFLFRFLSHFPPSPKHIIICSVDRYKTFKHFQEKKKAKKKKKKKDITEKETKVEDLGVEHTIRKFELGVSYC